MTYFYLSFCDTERPDGQQFLGATVVEADTPEKAFSVATAKGLNPGGEVAMMELDALPAAAQHFLDTFVPREQVIAEGAHSATDVDRDEAIPTVSQEHNPMKRSN